MVCVLKVCVYFVKYKKLAKGFELSPIRNRRYNFTGVLSRHLKSGTLIRISRWYTI